MSGPDYGSHIVDALNFPADEDDPGDVIEVRSGELALFSAAADGAGAHATELLPATPGPFPATRPPMTPGLDPGLVLPMIRGKYMLRVRWYTELGDDACFARWLLLPVVAPVGAPCPGREP